ncbi:hypothetical protein ERJ75_001350000 [Trypanosoma vivax]|uniref:Uncharacterized protein n=1 Tax=Trypanosoma vivax (strain Y486) TaxID=1055687 RepID=G0U5P3_TRYVY|nr:hypothetical protein TRVL_04178 [Trypanosoma vivax]KAH8608315.1 hypothetical protein ERJ75_001350000 [Trypanosoma vivax]CCC51194.1 hypothetical protein TVY486_1002470 [Trypanosoma vivax Y486]
MQHKYKLKSPAPAVQQQQQRYSPLMKSGKMSRSLRDVNLDRPSVPFMSHEAHNDFVQPPLRAVTEAPTVSLTVESLSNNNRIRTRNDTQDVLQRLIETLSTSSWSSSEDAEDVVPRVLSYLKK